MPPRTKEKAPGKPKRKYTKRSKEAIVAEKQKDYLAPDMTRNERVMENQGLVHQVARDFRSRGIPMEDLIQFGNIGLIRAAEKFEPERGLRFSTYAVYWIRQAIHKGIANTSRQIRVPLHANKEAAAVHRAVKEIEVETGTKPWISEALDVMQERGEIASSKRARLHAAASAAVTKFGVKPLDEIGIETQPRDAPIALAIDAENHEQFHLAFKLLSDEHQQMLTWRYGLGGSPPLVTMATAALLGISWRAAERIERAAIRELRQLLGDPRD